MRLRAAVIGLLAAAACDGTGATIMGTATRPARPVALFVNAAADAGALDLAINGQPTAPNIAFRGSSGCVAVDPGGAVVSFTQTGATTPLVTLTPTFAAGGRFTALATGTRAQPRFLFLADTFPTPAAGRARVRLVNAAPTVGALDAFVTAPNGALTTPVASGLNFNGTSTFLDVPAGATQVRFTTAGTQDVVVNTGAFSLAGGQARSLVVVEASGGGGPVGFFALDRCR